MVRVRRRPHSLRRLMTSWLKQLCSDAARRARRWREARGRRLPRLRVAAEDGATIPTGRERARPQVYYLCVDSDWPTGGNRTIYRHVDALNAAGIAAAVLHHRRGFACSWFDHDTRVTGANAITLTPRDILVVPEFYGPDLHNVPPGPRLVILNQGAYLTFAGVRSTLPGAPYRTVPAIEAILVVSHDSADYLRYAFPEMRIARIRNVLDGRIFHPSGTPPGRRIAVMPRNRAAGVCAQLFHLLRARGCLEAWEIVNIDGHSERETAEALRSCAIFLSFSEREGFGMPPAEAMACGCYVIGFTGLGGREYFDPATSTPVEEGNILAFAKATEQALLADDQALQAMRRRALAASAHILAEYSPEHQRDDLLAFFGSLFARDRLPARPDSLASREHQTMSAPAETSGFSPTAARTNISA